jgi:hypothetical protein
MIATSDISELPLLIVRRPMLLIPMIGSSPAAVPEKLPLSEIAAPTGRLVGAANKTNNDKLNSLRNGSFRNMM